MFDIVLAGGVWGELDISPLRAGRHAAVTKAPERLEQVVVEEILEEIRDIALERISERTGARAVGFDDFVSRRKRSLKLCCCFPHEGVQ